MKIDFKNNKKLSISLIIVFMVLSIVGGTFAFFSWEVNETEKTIISLKTGDGSLEIKGGNVSKTGMYPTAYCDGEAALIGDVATVTAKNGSDNSYMQASLKIRASLSVAQGTITDAKKSKINWAIVDTTNGTTCETTPYKGTFSGVTTNTDIDTDVSFIVSPGLTVIKTYQIYVWLDITYEHKNLGNDITDPMQNLFISVKFSPNSQLVQLPSMPNAPVLDSGMIPVKISNDGVVMTIASNDENWYDYNNKEWANVVLVKSSGTQTRDYYKSNIGVIVAEDDILAYYVWIPRYKYKIWTLDTSSVGKEQTIDIVFEPVDAPVAQTSQVGKYITHPAFIWDDKTIAGIWVGKFETGHSTLSSSVTNDNLGCTNEICSIADGLIIKPNVRSLRYNNVSNFFYVSRSMIRSDNAFGLSSSTTDTHMMKNSEWGAVAYLSHSGYGINSEIYINNSSAYYTGRSGGNVGGSVNSLLSQFPNDSDSVEQYNSFGYYTWTGQEINSSGTIGDYVTDRTLGTKASTTGNVTGIYDMSGGSIEYVMGYYSDANSNYASDNSYFGWSSSTNYAGFSNQILSKYWDDNKTNSELTACNGGICFGHATFEVWNWYSDGIGSFSVINPWFGRGGGFDDSVLAGAWYRGMGSGEAYKDTGFRAVAIVGT